MPAEFTPSLDPSAAWLELSDGRRVELTGDCRLGRSHENELQLASGSVSKRHAWIRIAPDGRFSLSDLGARNGTWVNDERVFHEVSLRDGDVIRIGAFRLIFRRFGHGPTIATAESTDVTETPQVTWLLAADIAGYTRLSQQLPPADLAGVVAAWRDRCVAALRPSGGQFNKQIGDGLLFHWFNDHAEPGPIAQALDALAVLQAERNPPFRWCLHQVGSDAVSLERRAGSEELIGRQVIFLFRMDSLAKSLSVTRLLTLSAATALDAPGSVEDLGEHAVVDFPGVYRFYRWRGEPVA